MKNNYQNETELFLNNQISLGFKPKWFITFHYHHPAEKCWKVIEDYKPLNFGNRVGFKCRDGFWNEVEYYNSLEKKRNDFDCIIDDASQIKNVMLKYLYGIKRLNQEWKYEFPNLFFFHEKGKVKLQYHTHLLIPEKNCKYSTKEDLHYALNTIIRKKRKCFSKWKTIHVREVDNPYLALSYVNKETCKEHNSLDYENSIFIPLSK
jgi:hypothetical protein